MTETLGTMHWRALDRDGEDKCRLARHEDGYMLVGHARFRNGDGWAALDYVVRCGPDWLTRSADVTGTLGGADVRCRVTCDAGEWALNGTPRPELSGCSDIDFSFTPATNLMPLRRLPEVGRLPVRAAWMRLPGPQLDALEQSYTRERGGLVGYHAEQTGFDTQISVDSNGFPVRYPGLWQQVDA